MSIFNHIFSKLTPFTRSAISVVSAVLLSCLPSLALAGPVAGTVVQLSGPMVVQKPDGTLKPLQLKSEVESGDTLLTQAGAYAQVRFIDNTEITMKPFSSLEVEQFTFTRGQQEADKAHFRLLKGGMRSVTGLLGQRSKEKFQIRTPSAVIGIRGTTFILEYIASAEQQEQLARQQAMESSVIPSAPVPPGGLAQGLHVYVSDGGISIVNDAGQFQYDPGQFGFIKDYATRPVKMTSNPGMQFSPPASFFPQPGRGE